MLHFWDMITHNTSCVESARELWEVGQAREDFSGQSEGRMVSNSADGAELREDISQCRGQFLATHRQNTFMIAEVTITQGFLDMRRRHRARCFYHEVLVGANGRTKTT